MFLLRVRWVIEKEKLKEEAWWEEWIECWSYFGSVGLALSIILYSVKDIQSIERMDDIQINR